MLGEQTHDITQNTQHQYSTKSQTVLNDKMSEYTRLILTIITLVAEMACTGSTRLILTIITFVAEMALQVDPFILLLVK